MRTLVFSVTAAFAVGLLAAPLVSAQERRSPLIGKPAPTWGVGKWFNLPEGKSSLDVSDFKGKVVYLYCFQSWCPGCHKHGFPTLLALQERFKGNPDVVFLTVQTTFEGFSTNSAAAAERTGEKYKLTIPVGQSGSEAERSVLMRNYRTGGTPWTIVIGKDGTVRYSDFHLTVEQGARLLEKLAGS